MELEQEQRRLDAFAADHQQGEQKYADERARRPAAPLDVLQASFDVAFHPAARAPHVDDHPGDRRRGDERERAFEPFLIRRGDREGSRRAR